MLFGTVHMLFGSVHMLFGGCGGVLGEDLCHWEGLLLPLTPISMWNKALSPLGSLIHM